MSAETVTDPSAEAAMVRCSIPEGQRNADNFTFIFEESLINPETMERGLQAYAVPTHITFEGSDFQLEAQTGALISTTAQISDRQTNSLGGRAVIGPNVTVGTGSSVGNRSRIYSSLLGKVTVGEDVVIAQGGYVYSGTYIGDGVSMGEEPHILEDVNIGQYSRFGKRFTAYNGVQVGRGVTTGDDVQLGAGTVVGGASHIGNNFVTGLDVEIGGQLKAEDDVQVGEKAQVGFEAFIGRGSRVGRRSDLDYGVYVVPRTTIPNGKKIRSGTVVYDKKRRGSKGV